MKRWRFLNTETQVLDALGIETLEGLTAKEVIEAVFDLPPNELKDSPDAIRATLGLALRLAHRASMSKTEDAARANLAFADCSLSKIEEIDLCLREFAERTISARDGAVEAETTDI